MLFSLLAFASCNSTEKETTETESTVKKDTIVADKHSFAKPQEAVMTHLDWDAVVDFNTKTISGTATLKLKKSKDAELLFLDTKELDIQKVTDNEGNPLEFKVHPPTKYMGSALEIILKPATESVAIQYVTSPTAGALQWLVPSQTAGKKDPFLFTQSQAILARSWIPCQDSPGIRFTYNAKVKVPSNLLALMSAGNPQAKNASGEYNFEMKQPIPAYLLALAVGDVEFRGIGARSGVYAEPSMIEKSVNEFADLEGMISAAEELYGEYKWERYDLIVLPPSFPFGGMENPRLTFATPTILAGDRSLVALVAHELAHSWSGNLVTNATWDDFWLNEGFTVYFENRIMEKVYGESIADMLALISYQDLQSEVAGMKVGGSYEDTKLKLDLAGRDPDEGVTSIAYDKGFYLLKLIEQTVGREKWDIFLKNYFQTNAFKTITTEQFLKYIDENLLSKVEGAKEKIRIEEWIYQTGIPNNIPIIKSDRFTKVEAEVKKFADGTKPKELNTENWVYQEWAHFLRNLPNELDKKQMKSLDKEFGFSKTGNSEVKFQWLLHVIRNAHKPTYKELEAFLMTVGRRKFIAPLYKEMMANEATQEMAKEIYPKARPNYHSVTYNTVDGIVK
ncbi:MAG: leukotriene A-4 hydrolase/aminopeptidase [Flammeovirgaceae bacterium]|jgi:leukotriene A-4 hydrolase/aminopeptidase